MNTEALLYGLSIGWLGAKSSLVLTEIIGSALYNLRQTRLLAKARRHPHARSLRKRPLISAVIYTRNSSQTIVDCLDSLRNSNYKNLEVIIIDFGSKDTTQKLVRDYIRAHPKDRMRLISKRKAYSRRETWLPSAAPRGDIILHLPATYHLGSRALHRAVQHFALQDIKLLVPTRIFGKHRSLIGLVQHYDWLRTTAGLMLGHASAQPVFERLDIKEGTHNYFADDVVLRATSVASLRSYMHTLPVLQPLDIRLRASTLHTRGLFQLIEIVRRYTLALEPLMVGYFLYLALAYQTPQPLIMAWGLGVFGLLFYVLADHNGSFLSKVRLVGLVPATYALSTVSQLSWPFSSFRSSKTI